MFMIVSNYIMDCFGANTLYKLTLIELIIVLESIRAILHAMSYETHCTRCVFSFQMCFSFFGGGLPIYLLPLCTFL